MVKQYPMNVLTIAIVKKEMALLTQALIAILQLLLL
jgi:hypothetical protein